MSERSLPPELDALIEDEKACLAFRVAVELIAGEEVSEDDQKRVVHYAAESGPVETPYEEIAGCSSGSVAALAVSVLGWGEVAAALDLLARELTERPGEDKDPHLHLPSKSMSLLGLAYLAASRPETRRALWEDIGKARAGRDN